MERLTYRNEQGIPEIYGIPSHIAIERLCAIEDILGDDYDLDRLKEIVEADKEGRCIVIPNEAWRYLRNPCSGQG